MSAHDPYFAALEKLLLRSGAGVPTLLLDLDRVDRNVDRLRQLQPSRPLRIVAKSLPCPDLLDHVMKQTGDSRLMVFHLPFLLQLIERFPDADILMGKPLPIGAMRHFYGARRGRAFDDSAQLKWLVDTEARLHQVAGLAAEIGRPIRICIEVDIGMHRGGTPDTRALEAVLTSCRAHRDSVRLAGFMGYDAHVPKAPWPHSVSKAAASAQRRFAGFVEFARTKFGDLEEFPWCINGAGSPTIAMHGDDSVLNDVSAGSLLVKPVSFDLPTLDDFEPAAWVATPVLKRSRGVRIPFVEKLPSRGRDSLFIYGGKWMASPHSPGGLRENATYGTSSNQQMLTVPSSSTIAVDDYVFLRPTQSEAVLLQFGDLLVTRDERIVGCWPVLQPGSLVKAGQTA